MYLSINVWIIVWLTQYNYRFLPALYLDLDIWEPSQRAQGSYFGRKKELNEII